MKHIDPKASAALFQLGVDRKLQALLHDFTFEEIEEYVKKVYSPDFGKTGIYSFFCKSCSQNWNFETKEDRRFFEQFHKATGCSFIYQDRKDSKAIQVKSPDILPENAKEFFNKIAMYKAKSESINEETIADADQQLKEILTSPVIDSELIGVPESVEVVDYKLPIKEIEEAEIIT